MLKIGLFLPTYNVAPSLPSVLESLSPDVLNHFSKVIVVDNGSGDQSLEIASSWAKTQPELVEIFVNQKNYSLGGSTIIAMRRAEALGLDWLVCMHTDGQAVVQDLMTIVHAIQQRPSLDLVSGSRLLPTSATDDYSRIRRWGNLFFCYLQRPLLGQKVYDIGSFLGFNMKRLDQIEYDRIPHDMSYHPLLILYWSQQTKRSLRILEIPITWGAVKSTNVGLLKYSATHLFRLFLFYLDHFRLGPRPNLVTHQVLLKKTSLEHSSDT